MNNRFRTISMYLALTVVTLVMLVGVRSVERALDDQVAEYNLRFTGQIRNAPPLVAFTTVALGSFRGLVADLLWLRAGSLQEKKSYFEMVQLAQWITDLQPTFSGATAYLAWNMAYNISVTCSSPEERWRWVNEGIQLIRNKALLYNPEDPIIYKELAWIFQHKLGNILDDANLYYKNQLAIQMMNIVGGDPDWEAMAAAPAGEKEFMRAYPPEAPLWTVVREAGFQNYEELYNAFKSTEPAALPPELVARLSGSDKLATDLLNYFRAELLRERLKLESSYIVELNNRYGMMDWRVPESQAIYWASMGILKTPGHKDISCDRIIAQSLNEAFRSGRLLMIDERNFESLQVVPNLALVDSVYKTYVDTQETYDGSASYSSFMGARVNFIKEAITILYNYGSFKKAEEYYRLLLKEEPGRKDASVEEFVMAYWAEEVKDAGVKKASEIISGLIFRSINYELYNDHDAALANERMARYIYRHYMSEWGNMERTKLPPYSEMKKTVTETCLKVFPPAMAELLKARIAVEQAAAEAEKKSEMEAVPSEAEARK